MNLNRTPIGILDSGVGGMNVASFLQKYLLREWFLIGKTSSFPLGNLSESQVRQEAQQAVQKLTSPTVKPLNSAQQESGWNLTILQPVTPSQPLMQLVESTSSILTHADSPKARGTYGIQTLPTGGTQCKLIVVACHTLSVIAGDLIRKQAGCPVIDMVDATLEMSERYSEVGFIGTKRTIESEVYQKKVKDKHKRTKVKAKPCPELAPLAEYGLHGDWDTLSRELTGMELDNLVLACTHYPLLSKEIQMLLPKTKLLNPAWAILQKVQKTLTDHKLWNDSKEKGKIITVGDLY